MVDFKELYKTNVNNYVEKVKQNNIELSYLSWSYAWMKIRELYPTATYEVKMFDNKPYIYDENLGYMVFTTMTIENEIHEMWLPVMNSANKAMKNKPYEYTTKYGVKQVEAATMFDINKTIMRCLAKNIAMFGLGLYIYNGEDIPHEEEEKPQETKQEYKPFKEDVINLINENLKKFVEYKIDLNDTKVQQWICKNAKVKDLSYEGKTVEQLQNINNALVFLIKQKEGK